MKVVPMNVRADSVLNGVINPDHNIKMAFENVTKDEFATIYFALREYADKLGGQLREHVSADPRINPALFEERMFTHQSLARINGVLFEMVENFNEVDVNVVRKWSEVI